MSHFCKMQSVLEMDGGVMVIYRKVKGLCCALKMAEGVASGPDR